MNKKLVSILIPAYNVERWISSSIQSALSQTWSNCEIIVVDDGSYDNTYRIAKDFESKNIRVIKQNNKGAAAARNHAYSLCQGDYIQWLDADDLLSPNKIDNQINSLSTENRNILLSSSFGQFYYDPNKARFSPTLLWRDLMPIEFLTVKYANNLWMNPAVWLVSREISEIVGPWNESLSLDDDGEYFARVVAASDFIKFVPDAKSYYRHWNYKSLSRSSSEKACQSLLTSLTLSINLLLSLENSIESRQAALAYLQVWAIYFYPEHKEMFEELRLLAESLGGFLNIPQLSLKSDIIRRTLGWNIVKIATRYASASRLLLKYTLDRFLS